MIVLPFECLKILSFHHSLSHVVIFYWFCANLGAPVLVRVLNSNSSNVFVDMNEMVFPDGSTKEGGDDSDDDDVDEDGV
jgi:hypothetical protein